MILQFWIEVVVSGTGTTKPSINTERLALDTILAGEWLWLGDATQKAQVEVDWQNHECSESCMG